MFQRILIANRGEIAVRIIRACHAMGIQAIAVYSEADRDTLHVRMADLAVPIGPAAATQSYLRAEALIAAARMAGAEAIHPGYGFLSERAAFARAVAAAGLVFIGPPAAAIEQLGDKIAAKCLAAQVGVPTTIGYLGADQRMERFVTEAQQIGFPLLLKAAAGGGGKGMRAVYDPADLPEAFAAAQREAFAAFGDATLFLEQLIEQPRHIEIQVLADSHGQVVHLFERECSIQRRHQKIVEECPSPALDAALRESLGAAAVRLAQAAGYVNAGTVEFLLDRQGQYFFLEMNTRLQVEHPVTELVCGVDLVQLQIQIAAGMPLPFAQADVRAVGHAIEVRICAEDPVTSLPADGQLRLVYTPDRPGLRHDCGVETGDQVTIAYDSLLAKLIAYGPDRATALLRLQHGLREYAMLGVVQNIPLLQAIVAHPAFVAGQLSTDFLQRHAIQPHMSAAFPLLYGLAGLLLATEPIGADPWQAHGWRNGGATLLFQDYTDVVDVQIWRYGAGYRLLVGNEMLDITAWQREPQRATWHRAGVAEQCAYTIDGSTLLISWQGCAYQIEQALPPSAEQPLHVAQRGASLQAPMPGTILRILVTVGAHVEAQQPLIIMEAMKIEHVIHAPHRGVVVALHAQEGMLVARGMVLVALE